MLIDAKGRRRPIPVVLFKKAIGAGVFVCGTCLNFYGLADRPKVGAVSNLFNIVSNMQGAYKVITL